MKAVGVSVVCALLGWTLLACAPGPGTTNPCLFDVVECRDPEGFAIDPECIPEEPLAVELGQGERAVEPMGPGEVPELYHGSQGGQHLFAAIRVANPDPEYPLFRARLSYLAPSGDAGFDEVAERELVFAASDATELQAGELELASVLFRLPYDLSEPGRSDRLVLVVEDSCGRRDTQIHEFEW